MARAEPVTGGSMTTIDPTSIPVFDGDLAAVAAAAARISKAGTQVERAGVRVHARFQGLDGCYRAPESGDLLASTVPVRTRATEFGEHLTAVGRALATYVYQMRAVASRLDAVQSEACAFVVEQLPKGEDWDKDPAAVARNNALIGTVNALVVARAAVERDCANAINRITGGPTWQAAGQGSAPFQYGPGAIPPAVPTPWGRPVSPDLPWWRDSLHWIKAGLDQGLRQSKSFAYGFFVDGLVGTIVGLRTLSFTEVLWAMTKELTGHGSSAATREAALESAHAWRQLALTAVGVMVLGNVVLLPLAVALMAHPRSRPWVRAVGEPGLQTAKSFVAWDTWKHDPARALGATTFNAVTVVLPTKGVSGLGKGAGSVDDVSRAASATDHAADATPRVGPVRPRSTGAPPAPVDTAAARSGVRHLTDPAQSAATRTAAAGTSPTVETLRRALPTRDSVRRGVPHLDESPARRFPDGELPAGRQHPSAAGPGIRPPAPHPATQLPDDTTRPTPREPTADGKPASRAVDDAARPSVPESGSRPRPSLGDDASDGAPASPEEPAPSPEPVRDPGTGQPAASRASALPDSTRSGAPPAQSAKVVPDAQLPRSSGQVEAPRRLPDLDPRQLPRPVTGDPAPGPPYLPAAETRPPTRASVPGSHPRMPEPEGAPKAGDRAPDRQHLPDQESRQLSRRGAGERPPPDRPHPPETDPPPPGDDIHHQPHQGPAAAADELSAKVAEPPGRDITWDDVADDLPTDRSGYQLRPRDCEYLGITPEQIHWLKTRQAPLGMTPQQYAAFRTTLREALEADGVDIADVDVRLQGSAARGFSGAHKHFPAPGRRGWTPQVAERIAEWFGDDPVRPGNRPFDSGYKLGIDPKRSDYDVQISSDKMVGRVHELWLENGSKKPFIRSRYGFVERSVFERTFRNLLRWRYRWQKSLRRQVPPALFGSSGPPARSRTGMSAAMRDDDWIIDLTGD